MWKGKIQDRQLMKNQSPFLQLQIKGNAKTLCSVQCKKKRKKEKKMVRELIITHPM